MNYQPVDLFIRNPSAHILVRTPQGDFRSSPRYLGAVGGITYAALQALVAQGDRRAKRMLSAIRAQQERTPGVQNLILRIAHAVAHFFQSLWMRFKAPGFEESLHQWCSEALGTEEYANRISALHVIRRNWLSKADYLHLASQKLTSLPDTLGQFSTHLKKLYLGNNRLVSLPWSFQHLHQVISIHLTQNRFVEVPRVLEQMRRLRELFMQQNRLTTLPEWMGNLQLSRLEVSNNRLTSIHPGVFGVRPWSESASNAQQALDAARRALRGNRFLSQAHVEGNTIILTPWGVDDLRGVVIEEALEASRLRVQGRGFLSPQRIEPILDVLRHSQYFQSRNPLLHSLHTLRIDRNQLTEIPLGWALFGRSVSHSSGRPSLNAAENRFSAAAVARFNAFSSGVVPVERILRHPSSRYDGEPDLLGLSIYDREPVEALLAHMVALDAGNSSGEIDFVAKWEGEFLAMLPEGERAAAALDFTPLRQDEAGEYTLQRFLQKLLISQDYQNGGEARRCVVMSIHQLLARAVSDAAFRQTFLELAEDSLTNCRERGAVMFLEMEMALQRRALDTSDLQAVAVFAVQYRRYLRVKELAFVIARERGLGDPLETGIYLFKELKGPLGLLITLRDMANVGCEGIGPREVERVKRTIQEEEQAGLERILPNVVIWQEALKDMVQRDLDVYNDELQTQMEVLQETGNNAAYLKLCNESGALLEKERLRLVELKTQQLQELLPEVARRTAIPH